MIHSAKRLILDIDIIIDQHAKSHQHKHWPSRINIIYIFLQERKQRTCWRSKLYSVCIFFLPFFYTLVNSPSSRPPFFLIFLWPPDCSLSIFFSIFCEYRVFACRILSVNQMCNTLENSYRIKFNLRDKFNNS